MKKQGFHLFLTIRMYSRDYKDVFEGFFKYLEGVKVNNSFSLILVDIKEQRVVEERFIPRHDGKEQKSLFIIKKDSRE